MHPAITHQSMLDSSFPNPMIDDRFQDSIQALQAKQLEGMRATHEFYRLCFDVFNKTEDGKNLMEAMISKYIMSTMTSIDNKSPADHALWMEGFKACIVMLKTNGDKHQQVMKGQANVGK